MISVGSRARRQLLPVTLVVILIACVTPSATADRSLTEKKKTPLDPEVERALAAFAEKGAPAKAEQFKKHMEGVVEAMGKIVTLTPEDTDKLKQASTKAVDEAVAIWKPLLPTELRVDLSALSPSLALSRISGWKADSFATQRFVENATRPDQLETWTKEVQACLGPERSAQWEKEVMKRKDEREKEAHLRVAPYLSNVDVQLGKDIATQIESLVQGCHLSPEQRKTLDDAKTDVLKQIKDREVPRTERMLQLLTDDVWKDVYDRHHGTLKLDIPEKADDAPEWVAAVKRLVPAEPLAAWRKDRADKKRALTDEVTKGVQPLAGMVRDGYEEALRNETSAMAEGASISPEHVKLLDSAAKTVVADFMKQWEKKMVERLATMNERQRSQVYARRMGISVNLEGENDIRQVPAWKAKVKEILSPDEQQRWQAVLAERRQLALQCFSRVALMEMDKRVYLTAAQREKLEPVAEAAVKKMFGDQGIREEQEYDVDSTEMIHALAKAKEQDVKPLLDEAQWKRWKDMANYDGSDQRRFMPMNGPKPPAPKPPPAKKDGKRVEPPSAESVISEHLFHQSDTLRSRYIAAMQLRVEEAARLGALPPAGVARLATAAKGAVENMLSPWKSSMDSYVRSQLQDATPQNVRPKLEGMGTISMSGYGEGAQDSPLWKTAIDEVMPAEKKKLWKQEQDARNDYQNTAMTGVVLYHLQRQCPITREQWKNLEPLIKRIVNDYTPDLNGWFSSPWYLYSYYVFVPLAGVPEKDLEKVLGPTRMKQVKNTVLPRGQEYWDSIKEQHDQRVRNGGNGYNGISISF